MERVIIWTALVSSGLCLWLLLRHDWLRWTRPMCEAEAEVIGQRMTWSDSTRTYAARLRFEVDGQVYDVTDQLYGSKAAIAVGTRCRIMWPQGRPDLARIPRPWMWVGVYAVLLYVAGIMAGKLCGYIQ